MSPEENLSKLNMKLPPAPKPLGSYIPVRRAGELLFLSGMLPMKDGKLWKTGKVDKEISIEDAQECARLCVINALSVLKAELGELSNIKACVRVNGFIASSEGFTAQPKVLNAASDLLVEILGEAGRHSRTAIGVYELPLGSPIEVDFVFSGQI